MIRTAGFPDAIGTYGLISGIWTSSFALGGFIGPTIAGILYDLVGFRWATQFVLGSFIILVSDIHSYCIRSLQQHCECVQFLFP